MTIKQYKLSFTTGDLYYQEAIKAAELYFELQDWAAVRAQIVAKNLLQRRTYASTGRILRELLPRLRSLSEQQLDIIMNGSRDEQIQVLWFAVCNQYEFIREFTEEVIREKVYRLDFTLSYIDFDAFFNVKAEWHSELIILTDQTRRKLRRVLFQMLRQAGILSSDGQILPVFVSPSVAQSALDNRVGSYFPITETDLKRQVAL